MLQLLRDLIAKVDEVRKEISKVRTVNINSQDHKKMFQQLVDIYFRDVRPSIMTHSSSTNNVANVDSEFQKLLVLSHKRTKKDFLKRKLSLIKKTMVQMEKDSVLLSSENIGSASVDSIDKRIIQTLQLLVPSAALSYEQALADLAGPDRKSWRGPAADLREALRETLDHLAPDKEVMSQPNFKLEINTTSPTMKQKTRFILRRRGVSKTMSDTPEKAVDSIETAIGSFVRSVYTRSSVSTHTPTVKHEVLRVRDWVRIVLCELLEIH